jgi:hypothetical protein
MVKPLKGGTTRPWLGLVDDGGPLPQEYVVKLFSAHDLSQANYVAAEVMGSVLCKEFDIDTPDFCLVEFTEHTGINCPAAFSARLRETTYPQPWFASRSELPNAEFTHRLLKRVLPMKEDAAALFAFDCLILNTDRKKGKPNLLLNDGKVMAIDHERAFALHNPVSAHYLPLVKQHVLYPLVRRLHKKEGAAMFDTFHEYLRILDLNPWLRALDDLEHYDMGFVHRSAWEKYLQKQKSDPGRLVESLSLLLK